MCQSRIDCHLRFAEIFFLLKVNVSMQIDYHEKGFLQIVCYTTPNILSTFVEFYLILMMFTEHNNKYTS